MARTRTLREHGFYIAKENEKTFSAWEDMLLFILHNPVTTILVDLKCRLHLAGSMCGVFGTICAEKGIQIIEVTTDDEPTVTDKKRVAIYHFTNISKRRPIIYEKDIDRLYERVSQQKCWDAPYVFLDVSLRKSRHEKYNRFRRNADKFDVLLVTDFFHIEDKTGTLIKEAKDLLGHGMKIVSLKEGSLCFKGQEILEQELDVVTYDRINGETDMLLEQERRALFLRTKTKWNQISSYIEENMIEQDREQKMLRKLFLDRQVFDVLFVRRFHLLNWRTSMFFKIVKKLNVPVYSMSEGGIYLGE